MVAAYVHSCLLPPASSTLDDIRRLLRDRAQRPRQVAADLHGQHPDSRLLSEEGPAAPPPEARRRQGGTFCRRFSFQFTSRVVTRIITTTGLSRDPSARSALSTILLPDWATTPQLMARSGHLGEELFNGIVLQDPKLDQPALAPLAAIILDKCKRPPSKMAVAARGEVVCQYLPWLRAWSCSACLREPLQSSPRQLRDS